jgi:hypothetical protein
MRIRQPSPQRRLPPRRPRPGGRKIARYLANPPPEQLIYGPVHWLVDSPLTRKVLWGEAIPSRPERNLCRWPRWPARWISLMLPCRTCGREFVFAAREQAFWYEELGFELGSYATSCPACRRRRRWQKGALKRYRAALEALPSDRSQGPAPEIPAEALRALATAIIEVQLSGERVALPVARRVRNLLARHHRRSTGLKGLTEIRARLEAAIRGLEAAPPDADGSGKDEPA